MQIGDFFSNYIKFEILYSWKEEFRSDKDSF